METVNNKKLLAHYVEARQIGKLFTGELPRFLLLHYSPGELLTNPFSPSQYLQFVVDGELFLYDMPDESSTVSINTDFHHVNILGDVELMDAQFVPFFVEARTDVYTLALYLEQYRERLLNDPAFLRFLCTALAGKLSGAVKASTKMTLRQQVTMSLGYAEPGQTITDITKIAKNLNASSRQLLRVLGELCQEGVLIHEKKGVYRIVKHPG